MKGFSFLSLIVVCALIGLLYLGYLSLGGKAGAAPPVRPQVVSSAARGTTCRFSRKSAEKKVMTWSLSHPGQRADLARIQRDGVHIGDCPEGGRWKLNGATISCSRHSDN